MRLLTVLVHFSTPAEYSVISARRVDCVAQSLVAQWERFGTIKDSNRVELGADALTFAREARHRVPHRYNDVAAHVEVIYDGWGTIKSYAFVARDRKKPRSKLWRTPRRDLEDKVFEPIGKCSEFHDMSPLPWSNDTIRVGLLETARQVAAWVQGHSWSLEWDPALIDSLDWAQYIAMQSSISPGNG